MRLSFRFVGVLVVAKTSSVVSKLCKLTYHGEENVYYTPGPNTFQDMIACQLDYDRWGPGGDENTQRFIDWTAAPLQTSIMRSVCGVELDDLNPYKAVLENMLKYEYFILRPLIRPQTNVLCLLVYLIANEGSDGLDVKIRSTVQKLWRNLLTENFARYPSPHHYFFFLGTEDDLGHRSLPAPRTVMQILAERCGSIGSEAVYRDIRTKVPRLGFLQINWENLGTLEIQQVCQFAKQWMDGKGVDVVHANIVLEMWRARQGKFVHHLQPLAVQICYYDLKPSSDGSGMRPMYDASWIRPRLHESKLSNYIAEKLMMNMEELTEFCHLVKEFEPPVTDAKMIELALESINRQSDVLLEIFKIFTGTYMGESMESRFYTFIERASREFNVSAMYSDWQRTLPLQKTDRSESICGLYPPDYGRLSEKKKKWQIILQLAQDYSTWPTVDQERFCDLAEFGIVNIEFTTGVFSKSFDLMFQNFNDLLRINMNTPQINRLCGRITRAGIPPEINLSVLDGLVAEAGATAGCNVVHKWNNHKIMDADRFVKMMESTVAGHLAPPPDPARISAAP